MQISEGFHQSLCKCSLRHQREDHTYNALLRDKARKNAQIYFLVKYIYDQKYSEQKECLIFVVAVIGNSCALLMAKGRQRNFCDESIHVLRIRKIALDCHMSFSVLVNTATF